MAEKSFWGWEKISWRTTGLQNLVYHPLIVIGILGPLLVYPHWGTALWAGITSGVYHEWTQADAGAGRPNLMERILDVLGHGFGSQVLWWGWVLYLHLTS